MQSISRRALPALLLATLTGGATVAQDYPFVAIGPTEGLPAPDPAALDAFGAALAVDVTTALIGSPGANALRGKVDVFERDAGIFTHVAALLEPSVPARAAYGAAVAIDGDTVVVGAPNPHFPPSSPGQAWVYERVGDSFELQQVLTPSNGLLGDQFGRALALQGDRLVVGAPYDDDQGSQSGSAYVFERSGTTWSQVEQLLPDDGAAGDQFGRSLSLDGSTLLVGAWLSDVAAVDGGAAYVFVTDDGVTWTQQAQLLPADIEDGDQFGESVAVHADLAVVGAPFADQLPGLPDTGFAYRFDRVVDAWSESATLQGTGATADGHFGCSISLSGGLLLVGSPGASNGGSGAATLFEDTEGGGYSQVASLAPTVAPGSAIGTSVAVGPAALLLGAPMADGAVAAGGAVVAYGVDVAGEWIDLGLALAGTQGEAALAGSGTLIGDAPFSITMSNGLPSVPVFLLLGFTRLDLPFKQGTFVPSPDFLFQAFSTNASGELLFASTWPTGFPGPYSTYFQVWFADAGAPAGFAASNGLEGAVAP